MSAEKLFRENTHVYFWTVTFVRVLPDSYYGNIWRMFVRAMHDSARAGRLPKTWGGVRVVEPFDHGLHYHALVNRRLWVGEMRRLGRPLGIGRIHVRRAVASDAEYLAKYVAKDFTVHGVRKWASIGTFSGVRVRDIETDSLTTRATRFLMEKVYSDESQHKRYLMASGAVRERPELIPALSAGGVRARRAVGEILSGGFSSAIPGDVRNTRMGAGRGLSGRQREGGGKPLVQGITRADLAAYVASGAVDSGESGWFRGNSSVPDFGDVGEIPFVRPSGMAHVSISAFADSPGQ